MSRETQNLRVALDIGSTVIKVAMVNEAGSLVSQRFYSRDFDAGIVRQVESVLESLSLSPDSADVQVCSSANGGLRVGIVCLTRRFSGAVLRDQALLAGANPIFLHSFDEEPKHPSYADILLVGGGIDCEDAWPMRERLHHFDPERYRYTTLLYAGNKYLAGEFCRRFPSAVVVSNPLSHSLVRSNHSVFATIRRAYLDDLVYKEGVSELRGNLSIGIRPTPEVVSLGFQCAVLNRSRIEVIAPCLLLDIGGATTDLHYTVEILKDNNGARPVPMAGTSVGRYVFTDLGIVASRDSLLLQMRSHPRLFEFLSTVLTDDVTETYRLFREGDYQPSAEVLAAACLFLALDRFALGHGPGLSAGDLAQLAQLILTGGGAQVLTEVMAERIAGLLLPKSSKPAILIDRNYQVWVEGMTFTGQKLAPAAV